MTDANKDVMGLTQPLVAHVVFRFGMGGLENGIVNLVNHMPARQWRHAIIALTDVSSEFAARIERPDVQYVALGKKPGHLIGEYPRLTRLFRELKPAIVHTRNLAALEAVVPAWAAGVPVRVHGEHGWDIHDPAGRRRRYRLVRRAYRPFVNHYVALSRHLEDYLEHRIGVAPGAVSQIYNGVDTETFFPSSRERLPIPGCPFNEPSQWLIGTVGRMEAVKDPLNLVHAFVRALALEPAAAPHLRLLVVGEGTLRAEAEAVLARAGAGHLAWFAGERADVADILRGIDCFVLPSLAEGISNTILEAMATCLPIVATQVGGNSELIESGMTGTLVPAANSDALARATLGYFGDRSTARRHARAAQRVVEARFSLKKMVSEYARMYERALAEAGVPVRRSDGAAPDDEAAGSGPTRAAAH